ncbi:hypothetical protein L917_11294 [Phytophthora nicotianae]|uniref:Uncharacterized protein n=2 Tax=Phytophthora nicotianae TaxID=4792 RepID=W2KXG7_PHYNI|nr:hypothetical protein L917_11294 [Phytophthora nicotianae]
MKNVLRFTTHYVAGQIEGQYAKGLETATKYSRTTLSQDLKKVKQFTNETFATGGRGSQQKMLKSLSKQYREAVRATHLIANELADIEGEDEFDKMLTFVLAQWCNVRQKKMLSVSENVSGDESGRIKEVNKRDRDYDALVKKSSTSAAVMRKTEVLTV